MDKLIRMRKPLRVQLTRYHLDIIGLLQQENQDEAIIISKSECMSDMYSQLEDVDKQITEILLDDDTVSTKDLDDEFKNIAEYKEKYFLVRVKIDKFRKAINLDNISQANSVISRDSERNVSISRKFPKLNLKQFDGDLKQWLGFWAQFRLIHEDEQIPISEKFQYLLQSMTKGSKAQLLVESYPQCDDNYCKAVDALKKRFGRDDLLVEVYVRELLKMVIINNNGKVTGQRNLSKMYDTLESHLRSLESLGMTSEKYALMLYPLVESSLPEDLLRAWQRSSFASNIGEGESKLVWLMKFLSQEVESEERITLARGGFEAQSKLPNKLRREDQAEKLYTTAGLHIGSEKITKDICIFCDGNHVSDRCIKAQTMPLEKKKSIIQDKRCCYCCFKPSHIAKNCKVPVKCVLCGRKHYVLICPQLSGNKVEAGKNIVAESSVSTQLGKSETIQNFETVANHVKTGKILLQTILVNVVGSKSTKMVRVMLDGGAQRTYITDKCVEAIGARLLGQECLSQVVFGGEKSNTRVFKRYGFKLESITGNGSMEMQALNQNVICSNIPKMDPGPWLRELSENHIWINDMTSRPEEIDILIGCDYYGSLLTDIMQLNCGLTAIKTIFGWTITGNISDSKPSEGIAMAISCLVLNDVDLSELWKLEALGISDPCESLSKEERDQFALDHFKRTVTFNCDGRYEVCLPWVLDKGQMPRNRDLAEKRLISTTKGLITKNRLEDYHRVFNEWLDDKLIEMVPESELDLQAHYLPHRPVFKDTSKTTPVRPVFDASAKVKKSLSLNDSLEKGPNLLELIPAILLKFREKRIGVIADIRKAFMMISVHKTDRDFLRFLWWNKNNEIVEYRHNRVVFGVTCSPFLLGAVIEHHLDHAPPNLKLCAEKLKHCIYVDNCITSLETFDELTIFRNESVELLASAGMNLCEWEFGTSNELQAVTPDSISNVLGMRWDKIYDSLSCVIPEIEVNPVTKRKILSSMQKIYDPMGYLAPVTLIPKVLLQQAWLEKIDWDIELTGNLATEFKIWASQISLLASVNLPRWIGSSDVKGSRSLHVFCDASQRAYSAAVFLRCSTGNFDYKVSLVFAKSRVTPIKKITIPRLELMAAVIGVRISKLVKSGMDCEDIETTFWSDSSTVLAWIKRDCAWGTFVRNRVHEILQSSRDVEWKHIKGTNNPADLPSRGCLPEKLVESRWWEGPYWLRLPEDQWPVESIDLDEDIVRSELKKSAIICQVMETEQDEAWYFKFSSYSKIVRIMGWILRFINNVKRLKCDGNLSAQEFLNAEEKIWWLVQRESFVKDTAFNGIQTTTDEKGIIRVNTKIVRRDDTYEFCYPIILPSKHYIVDCLVTEIHETNCHCGTQILMSILRENYWILQSRKTIRRIKGRCTKCRRYEAPSFQTIAAPLPSNRVNDAHVFEKVGTDLAGPLLLRDGSKCWLVIFTCAVYRAVHLELVTSLSTECFLQSLRRFISRRGRPRVIYSDNGTNFTGTENAFRALDWNYITGHFNTARIEWIFNPPTAAWWDSWWERLIRMVKDLLVRVLGKSLLDYEELTTVVCDVENVINSRPLTYVSEDADDLKVLTPAMFLREIRSSSVVDIDEVEKHIFQKRYRLRVRLMQDLRMRFRKEYIGQLIQKGKERMSRDIKVGDVVLVGSDNLKKTLWPLARVLEIYAGKDGICRVAKIKSKTGEMVRPVQRLYLLEVDTIDTANQSFQTKETEVQQSNEVLAKIANQDVIKSVSDTTEVLKMTRSGRVVKPPVKYL